MSFNFFKQSDYQKVKSFLSSKFSYVYENHIDELIGYILYNRNEVTFEKVIEIIQENVKTGLCKNDIEDIVTEWVTVESAIALNYF